MFNLKFRKSNVNEKSDVDTYQPTEWILRPNCSLSRKEYLYIGGVRPNKKLVNISPDHCFFAVLKKGEHIFVQLDLYHPPIPFTVKTINSNEIVLVESLLGMKLKRYWYHV